MAVVSVDPFDFKAPFPLDLRMRRANIGERDTIPTNNRWEGMLVYVISEQTWYGLVGGVGNENWVEIGQGGSGGGGNVTWLNNTIPTGGDDGDVAYNDTGNEIQLWYRQGGAWGMLGSWHTGGPSYTLDPSLPDPPTKSYLNTNYPDAKPGDVVYWEGTTQVVEAKCYAVGEWNYTTKNRAQ